jgi:hypothetical protein
MSLLSLRLEETSDVADLQHVGHLRARVFTRVRRLCAAVGRNAGYPLCAVSLWVGAAYGSWVESAIIAGIGITLSFIGFFSRPDSQLQQNQSQTPASTEREAIEARSFDSLYRRYGGVAIILASCLAFAVKTGWMVPTSYLVWLGLICLSVFIAGVFG